MKRLVKLLIEEKGIRRTPSIYISIVLAYLEAYKWKEAEDTIQVLDSLELLLEEEQVCLYLKKLVQTQIEVDVQNLCEYLYSSR